jgi:hypothetical protein
VPNYAVFSDRCGTTFRHADDLTEGEAVALAELLSEQRGWRHYAAPSNFNPHEGLYPDLDDVALDAYFAASQEIAEDEP